MHEDDTYIPAVAVAAVDVLGVKKLVSRSDDCRKAMNVLSGCVRNACERRMYLTPSAEGQFETSHAVDSYFGDSIYLFADPSLEMRVQVLRLVTRVATLIWLGLRADHHFLVRAGIAVGDLRKKVISTSGSLHELRIGTAMARAYELEANQMWIGGAIDASAPKDSEIARWTTDYEVPVKTRIVGSEPATAINWIPKIQQRGELETILRQTVAEIGPNANAEAKLNNTLCFVDHVYRRGAFPPFENEA